MVKKVFDESGEAHDVRPWQRGRTAMKDEAHEDSEQPWQKGSWQRGRTAMTDGTHDSEQPWQKGSWQRGRTAMTDKTHGSEQPWQRTRRVSHRQSRISQTEVIVVVGQRVWRRGRHEVVPT